MPEYVLIFGCLRLIVSLLVNFSRDLIKRSWSMPGSCIACFSGPKTLSFYGYTMQNLGPFDIFQVIKNGNKVVNIVAIYRPEVTQV